MSAIWPNKPARNDCTAADEARHEKAYKLFMGQVFALDPSGAVLAFAHMMKTKIAMPAQLMDDGNDPGLFAKFSRVAQQAGVYTVADYAGIIHSLVVEWKVSELKGLSDAAAAAQEFLCGLAERYQKLAERTRTAGPEKFSWIYGREIRPVSRGQHCDRFPGIAPSVTAEST
jgi:acyl-[acyl-carrier-protein] desaturase